MEKGNRSNRLQSFFIPFLAVLIAGTALFVFWLQTSTPRPTAGNQNNYTTNVNRGGREETQVPNDTINVQSLSISEDSSISGTLYVAKGTTLFKYDVASGKEELVRKVEGTATGIFSHHSKNGDVAYVRTNGDVDELAFTSSTSREPVILQKAYHGYTGIDEVQNSVLRTRPRFTPDGRYLVVEKVFWEGCGASVFDLKTKKVVTQKSCNALFWSPDSSRVVEATSFGIDTGPKLMVNAKGTLNDFFEIDWSLASGDVDLLYDRQSRTLKTGFVAAHFLSNDDVLLLTDRNDAQQVRLLSYNLENKRVASRALLPALSNPRMTVVGNYAFIVAFEGIFRVNLENGEVAQLMIENFDSSSADYEVEALGSSTAVVIVKKYDNKGQPSEGSVYVVDLAKNTHHKISDDVNVAFAGV